MQRISQVPNPMVVSQEEFDYWAILFDPETGKAFGVNPIGTEIGDKMDGKTDPKEIVWPHSESNSIMYKQMYMFMLGHSSNDLAKKITYLNMTGEVE
jgi:hypothetical protein